MKDNMLKEQDDGNKENLTLFKQQEANQNKMISKLQEQIKELNEENLS